MKYPTDSDPKMEDHARDVHNRHCTYLGGLDDDCPVAAPEGRGYLPEDYAEALALYAIGPRYDQKPKWDRRPHNCATCGYHIKDREDEGSHIDWHMGR